MMMSLHPGMHPALVWLVAGLVLMVIETIAPGVFMMWLGLAALGTGAVVELFDPPLAVQVVAFAIFAGLAIAAGLRLRRTRTATHINAAGSGLLGRTARILSFAGTDGRVRIGDSDWTARLAHGTKPPEPGDLLRVVGVDGTIVVVGGGPASDSGQPVANTP